jgi:hypothetical protein
MNRVPTQRLPYTSRGPIWTSHGHFDADAPHANLHRASSAEGIHINEDRNPSTALHALGRMVSYAGDGREMGKVVFGSRLCGQCALRLAARGSIDTM